MLEAHLQAQAFVSGAQFGMADIPLACEMHRWWGMADEAFAALGVARKSLVNFPATQAWWAALQQRPAARGVVDVPLS